MNGNFYTNDLLANIRHAERIAEADAYRAAKQVELSSAATQPASNRVFRSFGWIRRLVLRRSGAGA